MNPYLKYAPGGPVDPKKKVNVDGKEMEIGSDEYRKLYDTNSIMPVDSDGLPTMYGPEATSTAKAPDWLKVKRGEMTKGMAMSKAAMSELGNEFLEQTGIAGAYRFGKEPINNILGAGSYANDIMFNPYVAMGKMAAGHKDSEKFWNTVDAAGLATAGVAAVKPMVGAAGTVLPFSKVLKPTSIKSVKVPSFNFNTGNYKNILDKGLDIHDVRLKYHNTQILDLDELDMLNKYGKGTKKNYERALTEDVAGLMHTEDISPKGGDVSKQNILEYLTGTEQPKVAIPDKSVKPFQIDESVNSANFVEQEQNITKPTKFEIPSFYSAPYQRTSTSRAADKWLEDWFYNPETKQKFINYGGTEGEWSEVLNSLENPIKSNYTWGKNQPGGVYVRPFNQASIPLDATVDIGVHEGIHKAKLLLDKNNPVLHRLWNDFTDAVRLTPSEAYPEIFRFRQKLGLKPGQNIDLKTMEDNLHLISDGYGLPYKIKDKNKLLEIINKAPAVIPGILATGAALGSPSSEQQSYRTGGQNPYLPTYSKGGNTKTSEEKVNCTNCGWSWKLSEGGDDPYMCHECNHDNSQDYKETTKKQQYKKGGKTDLPCPPYCDNPLEPYERYEEEEKKRDPYNPNNKRIITEGKKTKPINKTLGWNVLEYFDPSGVSSWPDVADAWSDKRFTYNDIVEPLSAIPVLGKIPKTVKGILKGVNIFDTVDDIYNDNLRPILKKIPDMDPLKNFPPKNYKSDDYKSGGDAGHSTVEIERSERVYTPDGNLIMETPANAPTHEEGGVKVTLPAGSLVFPKKYYKALDAASGLPAFKKITNTMLDNAEKAYLRGEAYSSGGKRK